MSAPPSENTPINQPQQQENMSHSQAHSETKSSNERIIPIHIEGRDEPVLPKNVPHTYSQQHSHQAGAQPDRLFGKPTEHFTQFLPHDRDTRFSHNWNPNFASDEHIRPQRFHPQQTSQRKPQEYVPTQTKGEIPIPVQREVPMTKTHQQPQQSKPPQPQRNASPAPPEQQKATPPPQTKPLTSLEQIEAIQKDVASLVEQVEAFTGKTKDKQYLYLDEMLTRNLIKLDNIDTQGQESIRSARKEAIRNIEKTISILEAKAAPSTEPPKDIEVATDDEGPKQDEALKQDEEPKQEEIFPKEEVSKNSQISSEGDKEMEVDDKAVEEKEAETSSDQKNIETMEVEPIKTTEEATEKMETTEEPTMVAAPTNLNEESKEAKMETVEEPKQGETVPEEKVEKTVCVEQDNTTVVGTQVADVKVSESENTKKEGDISEKAGGTVAEDEKNETDAKEKKDKKKGKKKVEKKEK